MNWPELADRTSADEYQVLRCDTGDNLHLTLEADIYISHCVV